jgi:multicomponent Na+:H+ antiporter subunit G
MAEQLLAVAADVLVALGLIVCTLGVAGLFRMPDAYTKLHAASKAVVLGVIAFLVAALAAGDAQISARVVLIGAFLLLTTPVAAHAIARAAYTQGEQMRTPGAREEAQGPRAQAPGPAAGPGEEGAGPSTRRT